MHTFQTPEPIAVDIAVNCGDVFVTASDRTDTVVQVRPTDPDRKDDVRAAEQIRIDYAAGKLVVHEPSGWQTFLHRGGRSSIQVSIEVPAGSRLGGRVAAGRVLGTGELGECDLKVAAGDITIERPRGSVKAKTDMGSIRIGEAARGVLELETSMGTVEVGIRPGSAARLKTKALCGTVQNLMEAVEKPQREEDVVQVNVRNSFGSVVVQHATAA
ncbi:hypothetical protein GV791_07845 [Nocardia cyriacigeorgica]|uniref:DUF4097 domain-containing protein n=1 Tax=Nocardia cyriacigeorgica TaxID=135487 RepID=A0A6P1CIM7_9NOCA|nr:hypothetical protein [Nocardia cyriacigeorgica]NEW32471.1 hypothetical protein [Nocardia cyriacigeorgica]